MNEDCWIYLGPFSTNPATPLSYGRYGKKGAHRISYEIHKGPIPPGLTIDHLCRNTFCINPEHLEIVTRGENVLRGMSRSAINARKTHCPRGHIYAGENLGIWTDNSRPYRFCKTCRTKWHREYYQRNSKKILEGQHRRKDALR